MSKSFLFALFISAFAPAGASAYMAPAPVPIPAAFQREMSPYAACAAEAQEQFLSGPAHDAFMQGCTKTAVARYCADAASAKGVMKKRRAAFVKNCAAALAEAER